MPTDTQLPDGRWVPAQPMPYYRDIRPWYVKVWHCIQAVRICFIRDREKRHAAEDRLDRKIDKKWMVPVEPYTDKQGNWRTTPEKGLLKGCGSWGDVGAPTKLLDNNKLTYGPEESEW